MLESSEKLLVNLFCAKYGADLDLVQGQGGNFSIKGDGWIWIKASGFRLEEALTETIFVMCDLEKVHKGYRLNDEAPIKASVTHDSGLRPSIETSLNCGHVFDLKFNHFDLELGHIFLINI